MIIVQQNRAIKPLFQVSINRITSKLSMKAAIPITLPGEQQKYAQS